MGCPFHSGGEESTGSDATDRTQTENADEQQAAGRQRGVDRRSFVKSALAIGGVGAITQLKTVAGMEPTTSGDDSGPMSAGMRLNRQHAWDAFEPVGGSGNTVPPHNSLFLCLDYQHDGEPRPGHRKQVDEALSEIERHFEWNAEGVLFTMAYSSLFFDRYDADLPPGADPLPPDEVTHYSQDVTTDDEVGPDTHEVVLLLASSNAANLLAIEEALWGNDNDLDVSFDATFEGIFEKPQTFPDRRVGFLGPELPKDRYQDEVDIDVPDGAPLSMGFVAGFDSSMPEEDAVTLHRDQQFPAPQVDPDDVPDADYVGDVGERDPGVFAQGTLKHLSHIELDLDEWYDNSKEDRRTQMYSPFHTEEDVGEVGENLTDPQDGNPGADEGGDGDAVPDLPTFDPDEEDYADLAEQTAAEGTAETGGKPTLGHSQKAARARYDVDGDGDLEQPVLRRDWDGLVTQGETTASYNFNIPMRFNESALSMFEANYNLEFTSLDGRIDHGSVDTDEWKDRNGIAPYMSATFRGHFLVPPITLRALPHPQPATVDVSVERDGDEYVVLVSDEGGSDGGNGGANGNGRGNGNGNGRGNGNGNGHDNGNGGGNAKSNGHGTENGNDHGQNAANRIDDETVRFGAPSDVNQARGAAPTRVSHRGGRLRYSFDAESVDLNGEAKLFAKREGDRKAVVGTTEL